jgi:hypothetical protein
MVFSWKYTFVVLAFKPSRPGCPYLIFDLEMREKSRNTADGQFMAVGGKTTSCFLSIQFAVYGSQFIFSGSARKQ